MAIASLLLCLLDPVLLDARQEFAGEVIEEIRIEGLTTLSDETVMYYLGLEQGDRLNTRKLNENIKELWSRKLIDDIRIDVEPTEGGVRLILTIRERPILVSIDYQGLKKVNRSDVADRMDEERIDLYEGNPLELGELIRLKAAIEDLYREKGYRFAQVEVTLEEALPGERRAIFTIDEGDKVKIGEIRFEGNEVFSQGRLQRAMKGSKETGLISRIRKKDVFKPAKFEEDLQAARDLYRSEGFKNVVVGEPVLEIAEGGGKKRRLVVIIPIEEGDRWKLGEISIEGNEILSDQLLLRAFERPKGGWLRSTVIDKGIEQIQEVYNNTGYIFAQVKPETVEREDQIADVIVHVQENDQFRVGRLEFLGNTKTKDKVLRREMRIHEGMVFNAGALKNSLFKLNQMEFFKLNEEEPLDLDYDPEEKRVDLVVKGDEAERTEMQFGGGWSEVDGFFAQFSIRSRNFLGRGETLAAAVQTGRYRNVFDLSYMVPWFLDRPQSIGAQIFNRDLDYPLLTFQRVRRKERGIVLNYGRSLRLFQNINFALNSSNLEDFQSTDVIRDDGTVETLERSIAFKKSAIIVSYGIDSRDSRLETTRGRRLTVSLEYAGGFLGGEDFIVRPVVQFSLFKPLSRRRFTTVGAINARAGWVFPYNEQELLFLDRFFLGGENSIRGFSFRSIWVRDENNDLVFDQSGFPQGGDKFIQVNLEYHVVPGGPFRVVLFYDVGNVYDENQSIDLGRLRQTAGIEMRVLVPIFGAPLRFIWASNLDPLPEDRFESFTFSIGSSF